jgi:microcystin-dependent protein
MSIFRGGFVPAGTVVTYGANDTLDLEVPGWTACNGTSLDKDRYPELFQAIGYSNGGEGNLFQVPDLRGRFLRGKASSPLSMRRR